MPLVEDDHVVETLTSNGADHPCDKWILPRGARCGKDLFYPETVDASIEVGVLPSCSSESTRSAGHSVINGSDPRSPTAHSFSEAVLTVPFSPNLKGRSRRDDEWSALNEYGTWERE